MNTTPNTYTGARDARDNPVGKPVVILGTGGTGGHVYPAEAVARELLRLNYDVVVITDSRGRRYTDDFPPEVRIYDVPTVEMRGGLWRRMSNSFAGISAFFKAKDVIDQHVPRFVICFGGGASFATAAATVVSRIPLYLHEQNAVVGKVNRWFAGWSRMMFYSFSGTRNLPDGRCENVGNPIRPIVRQVRNQLYPDIDLRTRLHVLVMGGSQGASIMGLIVPAAIKRLPSEYKRRLFVLHQSRPEDVDAVRDAYNKAGIAFEVRRFVGNIGEELQNTHLVISRAGASTVSELITVGRPAILVPYPSAADNHQLYNAKIMTDHEAGWLFTEEHFTAHNLFVHLRALLEVPQRIATAAQAARNMGVPDAATALIRRIEGDLPIDPHRPVNRP